MAEFYKTLKQYRVIYIAITVFIMFEFHIITQFVYANFDGWTVEFSGVMAALITALGAMLKWSLENSRQDKDE